MMIIYLGFSLFVLMDFEKCLHWGITTLEYIFIKDVLA